MTDAPEEKPDPLEKSLGDQATGADVSRTDKERSLGDEATGADALSSISDVSGGLGEAIDSALPVIDLAARYEIEGELGQGGMGAVRLATDRQLKRKVAIKRILGPMAQSKTALQRFVTEAQSIAALNHFNIVQVHEFGRDAEGPLLVLEYVDGGSLLDKLSGGKLETEEAVDITCQLCDGLAVAHEQGIIHRDIKPANILLTRRGAPKLTDFGLARQETADHGQTQAGAVLGTIDFMPLEQRRDATATDARSDLWSLAATLYQMLTGKSPKVIRLDQLPANLAPVIGKMLEDDPNDRYEDARTFKQELQSASSCQVVASAARISDGNIVEGRCRECETINDQSRDFCKSCGAPLREPCLKCEQPMGIWEQFCGKCGGSVEQLLPEKQAELEQQKAQILAWRDESRYRQAVEMLETIANFQDRRFSAQTAWARGQLESFREQLAKLEQERDQAIVAARQALEQTNYNEAVKLLESVPAPMREGELEQLLGDANSKNEEARQLKREIAAAVQAKALDDLLPKVNRYLQLRPNSENVHKLKEQLQHTAITNSIGMKFVPIPAGEFMMGSPNRGFWNDLFNNLFIGDAVEHPPHPVRFAKPLHVGMHPVTEEQFKEVMGTSADAFEGQNNPVTHVAWTAAVEFCLQLTEREGVRYRLPTEAEWEYACRAGTTTVYSFGNGESLINKQLGEYAWFSVNSGRKIHPVGKKKPNPWGLYDMHGSVWEWCQDWSGKYSELSSGDAVTDPQGPASGDYRVLRGGSVLSTASETRSASRTSYQGDSRLYDSGFRVVREV